MLPKQGGLGSNSFPKAIKHLALKTIYKTLVKSVLSYFILLTLTNYPPPLCNDPGYGVCNSGCNTKEHHTDSHQLTKWTDKEVKLYYKKNIVISPQNSQILNFGWENQLSNNFNLFSLYSRPPPVSI